MKQMLIYIYNNKDKYYKKMKNMKMNGNNIYFNNQKYKKSKHILINKNKIIIIYFFSHKFLNIE